MIFRIEIFWNKFLEKSILEKNSPYEIIIIELSNEAVNISNIERLNFILH